MQRSQCSRSIYQSLKGRGGLLLATWLSLFAWLSLEHQPTSVEATEVRSNSTTLATAWQGASFPVEDFVAYTSPFGYRSSATGASSTEFHSGLDMAAPEGSYIRSWWAGEVVEVIDDGRCGTGLVIQSGNWEHIYCHMTGHAETRDGRRYFVDRHGGIVIVEGQRIPTAARIGRVGMTGRTTGPHLHWGLRYHSDWVDPALVLRAMYAEQS